MNDSQSWQKKLGKGKNVRLTINTSSNGTVRQDGATAILSLWKEDGPVVETSAELTHPTNDCLKIVDSVRDLLITKLETTYKGSNQPLKEIVAFVNDCFNSYA